MANENSIIHTKVGKGIKVLKAETYVEAGDMQWMLLVQLPCEAKAKGDAAPDGFATFAYHLPGYTFEARAAEYGLDDFEEVLELVLLECIKGFDDLDDADPYTETEVTCRNKKRATVKKVKQELGHTVTWASGVREKFNQKARFKKENVDVYKEVEVTRARARHASAVQKAQRQALAAIAANDMEDVGGPIAMAKHHKKQMAGRDGQRINATKKLVRGVVQDIDITGGGSK